jgi:hypothetical protein
MINAYITVITSYFLFTKLQKTFQTHFGLCKIIKSREVNNFLLRKPKHVDISPIVLRCSEVEYTEDLTTGQT